MTNSRYDFASIFSRWFAWLLVFSAAYWAVDALIQAWTGRWALGLVTLITGMVGNAFAAGIVALGAAVLGRWVHWRSTPVSVRSGAVWACILGGLLGIGAYYNQEQAYSSTCNDGLINSKFAVATSVLKDIGSSDAPLSSYRTQVDKIWTPSLNCDLINPADLSDASRAKYLDIQLYGNYESVVVYFDAKQYQLARSHLSQYTAVVTESRPVAIQNHWSSWLDFEKSATKQMAVYDAQLKKLGH